MDTATRFSILGPVTVVRSGVPVPVGGRRRLSLLAIFLLHTNVELSTSSLIDLLWSGRPPAHAANTLQVHVAQLRRVLATNGDANEPGGPEPLLVTRPSGYELHIERDRIDAHRFEDLLAAGRAALVANGPESAWHKVNAALSLWQGPALGNLAAEEFAAIEATRLDELRLQGEHARGEAGLATGRHREIVTDVERLVAQHPLREEFTAQLMVARYRCGQQAEALAAYRQAREVLIETLGLEPDPVLQRLEGAILRQAPELEWPPARQPIAARAAAVPVPQPSSRFVGRRGELATLEQRWIDALGGGGNAALLAGEPGIGKTRVATEIWRRAAADGATILRGQCTPDVIVPYQAIVEALTPIVLDAEVGTVERWLGSLHQPLTVLLPAAANPAGTDRATMTSEPGDRYLQFEAATVLLREVAVVAPVLLVVEDLHWADESTLLLLEHIARGVAGARILLVGTYRDTDLPNGSPLANPDRSLHRSSLTISLVGLARDEVGDLVLSWTGSQADPDVVNAVRDRTNGNPMFVEELLHHLGHPGEHAGAVDAPGFDAHAVMSAVPSGIQAMILRRIAVLGEQTRQVLAIASVAGTEFDVGLVADVAAVTHDELVGAIDEARTARIVVETTEGRCAFGHALIAESVLASLGPARRAQLHAALAQSLEARVEPETRLRSGELADHFARAGDRASMAKAWRYARDAARHATSVAAPEESVRRYADALGFLDLAPDATDADRCELLLELGEAAFHAGDRARSREAFAAAVEFATASGDADRLARTALGISGWGLQDLWVDYGQVNDASVALLERAIDATDQTDSPIRARLLSRLAEELYFCEGDNRRFALADEAVLMARRLADPTVLTHTIHGRLRTHEGPDTLTGRLADARELLGAAERSGRRELRCVAHGRLVPTLMEAGRFADADRHIKAHAELADDLRSPLHRIWSHGMRAARGLMEGNFELVERLVAEAAAISPEQFGVIQAFAGMLCVLRVEQGRAGEMIEVARQFVADFPHVPAWRAGFAVLLAEAGAFEDARVEIDTAIGGGLDRVRRDQNWMFCMAALAEACTRIDDAGRAELVYRELAPFEGRFVVLGDGYAVWCAVSKSLGILARVGGRFEEARAHLERALVAHEAIRATALTSRTEAELATVLSALGLDGDAGACRARANATATRIGQAV